MQSLARGSRFCAEAALEQPRQVFLRDARAVVVDAQPNHRAAVAAVVVLAVPAYESVRTVPTIEAFAANGGDGLEQLRDHLAAEGYATGTVWTDVRTVRLLPIFQRPFLGGEKTWTGKPKKLDDLADVKPGDSVLFYSAHDDTCFHCRIQIQPWIETHPNRPENWELVFATPTKPTYNPVGLELVRTVTSQVHVPHVAIGGIDATNVAHVLAAGAQRVAVVRAVCGQDDIASAAKKMKETIQESSFRRV